MPKQKNNSTGPTTEAGKKISSQNALTHGCCSTKILLPGDNQADYQTIQDKWKAAYPLEESENSPQPTLIERLASNDWLLRRAENRYLVIEQHLHAKDVVEWTEDEQKKLDRLLRYKTAAERSFYRSFTVLEAFRNNKIRQGFAKERLAFTRERLDQARQKIKEKPAKPDPQPKKDEDPGDFRNAEFWNTLSQFVQVTTQNNQPVATFHPANEVLLEEARIAERPVVKVWRKLLFPEGVPAAYHWTNPETVELTESSGFAQHMDYAEWLLLIEEEQDGLPGPARPGADESWNLAHPKE